MEKQINPSSPTLTKDVMDMLQEEYFVPIDDDIISFDPALNLQLKRMSDSIETGTFDKNKKPRRFILLKKIIFRLVKMVARNQSSFNSCHYDNTKEIVQSVCDMEYRVKKMKQELSSLSAPLDCE